MIARIRAAIRRRRICVACGHPSTQGNRLVRRDGWRIHRSHTRDRASGFYERASS
jgi:hypothetical protein